MKLKKKQYLGEGYHHTFQSESTGEVIYVPCTKEEYTRMGEVGGSKYNPTLPGHKWLSSAGGTIKVDNPDGVLKENEYCQVNGFCVVVHKDEGGQFVASKVELKDIVNDEVDVSKIKKY